MEVKLSKEQHAPSYDLGKAKALIAEKRYTVSSRPRRFVANHLGNPSIFIPEIIAGMRQSEFRKSMELDMLPGTYADVYVTRFEGDEWYVKFFINDEGGLSVNVLSCNWDGVTH